jgi:hypothetical protein
MVYMDDAEAGETVVLSQIDVGKGQVLVGQALLIDDGVRMV